MNNGIPSTIGHAAIIGFYGDMVRNGVTNFSYATANVWGRDNNLMVEEGTASFALSGGKVVSKERYLII